MKEVQLGYDVWSEQYDTNKNKTRDLEGISLRTTLPKIQFKNCLEIGCGTGKNTEWLISKATQVTAVDLSEGMLVKAKNKIQSTNVKFIQANINESWDFLDNEKFDLVVFSLVLEHIENLDTIFRKLTQVLTPNAYIYIGELHPFKQYTGTKARFEIANEVQELTCFLHHISDFVSAGQQQNFQLIKIDEYFDDDNRKDIPRILTLLFKKQ